MNVEPSSRMYPTPNKWVVCLAFRTREAAASTDAKIIILTLPPSVANHVAELMNDPNAGRPQAIRDFLFSGKAAEVRRVDWSGERREANSEEEAETIAKSWQHQLFSARRSAQLWTVHPDATPTFPSADNLAIGSLGDAMPKDRLVADSATNEEARFDQQRIAILKSWILAIRQNLKM